jgi:glycine betaine catabolism A
VIPTLPRDAYVSDRAWGEERERIFAHQWVVVGRTDDVTAAGDYLRADVAGEQVLVVRQDDGGLRGFYNVCRHRGAELVDIGAPERGHLGPVIRCPYHQWTYGLDGGLRRRPFLAADECAVGEIALHPIAVESWGGCVFAHLSPAEAGELAAQLGPVVERVRRYPLAELRRGVTFAYDVAANWKVLAENYNECYHCGPVHPELCELMPAFRRGGSDLAWEEGIPHRDGAWTFTPSGTSTRAPFPDLDDNERTRHKGELVYPNLLLSLAAEHVAAFTLRPRGPAHTTIVCDLLFDPDEVASPAFDPSDAADLWDLVNRQDWAICESVQRGMSSRVWRGGWFAPMEDESADISRWYLAAMGDGRREP